MKYKILLLVKALLIIIFVIYILVIPAQDYFRTAFRVLLLVFFTATFIADLNKYKKNV